MNETPNQSFEPNQSAHPVDELDFTPSHDDRNLAMLAHLSGIIGIFSVGFIGWLGPLVIYVLKKDSSPFVEAQAKEALNFQITQLIISFVCALVTVASCGLLFFVMFIPVLMELVFGIIAALAVRDGRTYQYPMTIRFLQ